MQRRLLLTVLLIILLALLVALVYRAAPTAVAPVETPGEVYYTNASEDDIVLTSPASGERIDSPLMVEGRARGYWFFEATAPVVVTNWDGLIIGESYIEAQGDWMTEDFVNFAGEVTFETPVYGERGTLILQKANASGLPEHDAALEIPILFNP